MLSTTTLLSRFLPFCVVECHAPIRGYDFCQRVPVVSGSAFDRSIHSSMVWRRAVDLDGVYVVFSDPAAGRVSVRACDFDKAVDSKSGHRSPGVAGSFAGVSADRTVSIVETDGW